MQKLSLKNVFFYLHLSLNLIPYPGKRLFFYMKKSDFKKLKKCRTKQCKNTKNQKKKRFCLNFFFKNFIRTFFIKKKFLVKNVFLVKKKSLKYKQL